MTAPRVLRLPRNVHGRDFVIGDVHGAYDLVIKGMKDVGFDRKHDRLISVGDLIDRGPESARCLKFLRQSFTFSIKGNHEQNLLEIYKNGDPGPELLGVFARMFSMQWWLTTAEDDRQAILAELAKLPVAIEIETLRGTVGMVHGDVPKGMPWASFLQKVTAGDASVLEVALEGRRRLEDGDLSGVDGVGRLFVGHTVQYGGAKKFGNVYAVDTGAVFNLIKGDEQCGLTIANIAFRTEALVNAVPRGAQNVMAIEADQRDEKPFGLYASPP